MGAPIWMLRTTLHFELANIWVISIIVERITWLRSVKRQLSVRLQYACSAHNSLNNSVDKSRYNSSGSLYQNSIGVRYFSLDRSAVSTNWPWCLSTNLCSRRPAGCTGAPSSGRCGRRRGRPEKILLLLCDVKVPFDHQNVTGSTLKFMFVPKFEESHWRPSSDIEFARMG